MLYAKNSNRVKWFQGREKENQEEYQTAGAWKREKPVFQVVWLLDPQDRKVLFQNIIILKAQ